MSLLLPSTFLDLCQRARQECGISGTGPSTVTGQTGSLSRLIGWVATAWNDIQAKHQDWEFLRASTSFVTVAGQAIYTLANISLVDGTTFGQWKRDTFRNYNTAAGLNSEIKMSYLRYDIWRDAYYLGALRDTRSQPTVFSIDPAKSICLGPVPLVGYTITGDYFTGPVQLTNDGDIPALPIQHRMIIVYGAMMQYGFYESAPEVYQEGKAGFDRIMAQLEDDRLPEIIMGGALA